MKYSRERNRQLTLVKGEIIIETEENFLHSKTSLEKSPDTDNKDNGEEDREK